MSPETESREVHRKPFSPGCSYEARLVASSAEVRAAQRLRFEVFNLELGEGLESSDLTGFDEDPFDAVCDHLIVTQESRGRVVGTCRLQTGKMAARQLGFYSAQEFDFSPYASVQPELIELGRTCVHWEHRNTIVLNLMWRAIACYANQNNGRFLIGCSSLASQDPRLGAAMYFTLKRQFLAVEELRTQPLCSHYCSLSEPLKLSPVIPRLLQAYLTLGATICGPPAIDRLFKSIDFLTVMDLKSKPRPELRAKACAALV
jgi:putative hemolysin